MTLLVLGLLMLTGCTSQQDQSVVRLKTLAQECINTCTYGVESFESEFSRTKCNCRNLPTQGGAK